MNLNVPTIVPLDRITPGDSERCGAKAFNCARLKQAGFPVPDGVVILSTATAADAAGIESDPWFGAQPEDMTFAVRSSGVGEDGEGESFAGIHETLLHVRRGELSNAIAACRASGHSPQALEYRRAKGMATDAIEMGVLVQCMVRPVAAGVAFTVNPVTGAADEVVINSSWGLGEALVSGQVDPDEFVIGKRGCELRWSRIGEKGGGSQAGTGSLTSAQLRELSGMLMAIERHYDAPQDVEWCHDGARFWIVQSRPVTTNAGGADEIEWTRANLAEVMPDITCPQALEVFEEMLNVAEKRYLRSLLAPAAELGRVVKAFNGRLYFNLSQMRRVSAVAGIAPATMLKSMGHADALQPSDEIAPRPSLRTIACLPDLLRMVWRHFRVARIVEEQKRGTDIYLNRFARVDPHTLPDDQVWTLVEQWFRDAPAYMQTVVILGGVIVHEEPVYRACARAGFSFERLVYPQLAAGERSVSAQQAFDLVALASEARREPFVAEYLSNSTPDLPALRTVLRGTAFLAAFEQFLEKYGHRGRYEYDWSLPRYNEDPSMLLQTIRVHLDDGSSGREAGGDGQRQREAAQAMSAFEQRLSPWQKRTMLPKVRRSIRKIKQYYVWREQVRSDLVRVLEALRKWHLVLAARFVERGWLDHRDDYFLLRFAEIADVVYGRRQSNTLRPIVEVRRSEQARFRAIQMPLLMRASALPALIRMAGISGAAGDQDDFTGHAVSGGVVEAEVVVVRDPGDFSRMKRGAILVAPATDPSWTPLFTLASGVIVEVGGVLSHASTIAREYGLPALANVKHATKRLRTGERVRLDAIEGRVYRLQPADNNVETRDLVSA